MQRKIQRLGNEGLQEKIAQYPHLVDLVQEIKDTVFPTDARTTGREEIIKTLTRLNDIIRLCSLIEPSKDPLGQLIDVPCIRDTILAIAKYQPVRNVRQFGNC